MTFDEHHLWFYKVNRERKCQNKLESYGTKSEPKASTYFPNLEAQYEMIISDGRYLENKAKTVVFIVNKLKEHMS